MFCRKSKIDGGRYSFEGVVYIELVMVFEFRMWGTGLEGDFSL